MEEQIGGGNARPLQRRKERSDAFGKAKQRRFLEHLAASCNVTASLKAAGTSACAVYRLRQRDAAFAAAWNDALAQGYDRLEEALLAKALADVAPVSFDAGAVAVELVDGDQPAADRKPVPGSGIGGKVARVDVQLALALLNRRQAAQRAGRMRGGSRRATAEEVEQAINAKLDRLAARIERQK